MRRGFSRKTITLAPAHDHLNRVLRGDFALDELPVLSLDLRRRLGGAQSGRKPQCRQTELRRVERRADPLHRACRLRKRLRLPRPQRPRARGGRLRNLNRRNTRPNDLRNNGVLRQAFRRCRQSTTGRRGRANSNRRTSREWDGRFRSDSHKGPARECSTPPPARSRPDCRQQAPCTRSLD